MTIHESLWHGFPDFDALINKLEQVRSQIGNFRGYKFSAAFRQPNFTKAAASEFADERIKPDLLTLTKHSKFYSIGFPSSKV